jgi:hypothetical protein
VTLASLDEPSALAPEAHIWLADRAVWAPLSDGLPKYERWRSER